MPSKKSGKSKLTSGTSQTERIGSVNSLGGSTKDGACEDGEVASRSKGDGGVATSGSVGGSSTVVRNKENDICCLDWKIENGGNTSEEKQRGFSSKRSATQEEKIAVEIDGPVHFAFDLDEEKLSHTVLTLFKAELLRRTGWLPLSIPFFSFQELQTVEERSSFLKKVLSSYLDAPKGV